MAAQGTSQTKGRRTATVSLPFVTAEFRAPDLHLPHVPTPHVSMPGRDDVDAAVRTAKSYLPSPKQVTYYGGLAALAAFQVIEWPVAVAIGIGTAVAGQREGRQAPEREGAKPAASAGRSAPATATKTTTKKKPTATRGGKRTSGSA